MGGGVGWVAHVILVSAQVLLVLTLGLWNLDFRLGLDNISFKDVIKVSTVNVSTKQKVILQRSCRNSTRKHSITETAILQFQGKEKRGISNWTGLYSPGIGQLFDCIVQRDTFEPFFSSIHPFFGFLLPLSRFWLTSFEPSKENSLLLT